MTILANPTPRTPRLTVSRHGFLARSTALSWPWNKDRIRAAPGTMPPSFADLALGLVDRNKPAIRMWCKDPMQREDDPPAALARAKAQGGATQSGAEHEPLGPRFREDDTQASVRPTAMSAQEDPVHRERTSPLRNGNPRGNPNLAPRCGARTRRTGCPCRAPAMRNGRCRLHGGKSTGPRRGRSCPHQRRPHPPRSLQRRIPRLSAQHHLPASPQSRTPVPRPPARPGRCRSAPPPPAAGSAEEPLAT